MNAIEQARNKFLDSPQGAEDWKELHAALGVLHKTDYTGHDGRTHTYYYNANTEERLLSVVIQLRELDGLNVDIVGSWVWVYGPRKEDHADQLKKLGLFFSSARDKWYWKPSPGRKSRRSYKGLQRKHGHQQTVSQEAENDDSEQGVEERVNDIESQPEEPEDKPAAYYIW